MPSQNNNTQPSPFEIVTPAKSKKGGNKGLLIAGLIVIFLILSVVAGVLLVQQRQNIQEKAAVVSNICPGAEACPYTKDPTHLWNCHPADTDGTVKDSICNTAGRVEPCGPAQTQYCCPAPGAAWTTDMTVCNSLAATPTPTPSPTPTVTPTPTPTVGALNTCNGTCGSDSNCASGYICSGGHCRSPLCTSSTDCSCTSSASPTPSPTPTLVSSGTQTSTSATPMPIPVTGIDWPTAAGIGVGAGAIILSILVAL